ncbi:hypothetical protein PY365_08795 [Roseiarcaceae bacterium H3SJ34-1]|uniref:hypothetical protein n=1 Tax=Terripilifer ovatus TaxID=3032367 RepID=UPI003AB95768|nr:hypothetical protein [Roseiarcaceae bacterium H3SJ34-1]
MAKIFKSRIQMLIDVRSHALRNPDTADVSAYEDTANPNICYVICLPVLALKFDVNCEEIELLPPTARPVEL